MHRHHSALPSALTAGEPASNTGSIRTVAKLLGLTVLLASCAAPPPSKPPVQAVPQSPPPMVNPAPAPVQEVAPGPASSTVVVTPATIQASQRQATSAIEMLEAGNEDQATAELQRALQNDPNNKLAQMLLKQIQADPITTLGRDSFQYKVQPGESISRIAQRFLGDVHLFYILARYNDLKVPKQLQSGQVIKVPGKAPSGSAATATTPVAKPAATPAPATPPAAASQAPQAAPSAPEPPAKDPERERVAKVAASTKAARAAYARQDLVTAIRHWDTVLELDPGNNTAKIERQRAVDLKAKLDKLK